jgi:hypothetical protein
MAAPSQKVIKGSSVLCLCIALNLTLGLSIAAAQSQPHVLPLPPDIDFSNLTGTNLQPYVGSVETTSGGTFTVTPVSGSWFEGLYYGNPEPDILVGPVDQPGDGVIEITDSQGPFTLSAFDYSSNNGNSTYDILGYLGGKLQYQEVGTLSGALGLFSFSTLNTADPTTPVDGLFIGIAPGDDVTSVNLDNIVVTTVPVPEPTGILPLGLGLMGFIRFWIAGREKRLRVAAC